MDAEDRLKRVVESATIDFPQRGGYFPRHQERDALRDRDPMVWCLPPRVAMATVPAVGPPTRLCASECAVPAVCAHLVGE
jgi:hypothetical protein